MIRHGNKMSIIFNIFVVYNICGFNQILSMFYKGRGVSEKLTLSIESCKIYKDIYVIMWHEWLVSEKEYR